ncbi:15880_t:CDS:2, partial [Cetraspora pellucida]
DMVNLLEPIERVTRRLCGAKYPTMNLVYPYIELLKKRFALKSDETRQSTNTELEDTNHIEYLPSVATDDLLCRVQAAIYLSLDELWEVPIDIALVVTFLDPRFKHFKWATSIEQNKALNLVKTLYNELKINLTIPDDNEESLVDRNYNDDDVDFFYELEASSTQADIEEDDEIMHYTTFYNELE